MSNAPLSVTVVVACWLALAGTAWAQAAPDELARRHFESGAAYFEQADYESALREFREAYQLSARPEILINIATVDERLSDLKGAIAALDEYLKLCPDDEGSASQRIRRDNLQKRLDAQTPPPAPAPAATPAPTQTSSAAAAPESEPNRVPSYVLFSVAGVSAAGALLTGGFAQAEFNDLKKQCAPNCANSETANAKTLAGFSTVLTGAAIASAVVGAVLWFSIGSDHSQPQAAARVGVGITPQGPMARARLAF